MAQKTMKQIVNLFFAGTLSLSGCTFSLLDITSPTPTPSPTTPNGESSTPIPAAAITFNATLPAPLQTGEVLYLSILDEVTGLGLNPDNHIMQGMDALNYSLTLPFPIGSVVKYRYIRQGTLPVLEDDAFGKPVRYRMYNVVSPSTVQDIVSSWSDTLFTATSGRITGRVINAVDGNPLTNILLAIGGQQTLTDSTGSYSFEGLPSGVHNLVAYALDGNYQTFQQGAMVVEDKTTPANISLTPAALAEVVFTVTLPENTIQNIPIRLAGNLYALGNTFGDLDGGLSSVASRMPVMTPLEDGRYRFAIQLPEGADIRYKYTLGDGFWNAEHGADGSFILRQLVIPNGQATVQVEDVVTTWQAGNYSPILFEVTVPVETPVTDIVSIQFNPYGWTIPIPMWPMGNNKWAYQLYGPLNILNTFEYRYCRNDMCGTADDVQTSSGHAGRPVSSSLVLQDLQDNVSAWKWLDAFQPASLVGLPVTARSNDFWSGVEFLPTDSPTWQSWMPLAILNVKALYSNWLVFTPTWTVSHDDPLVFSPRAGSDPLFTDTGYLVAGAGALNINAALFPSVNLPAGVDSWWESVPHNSEWWSDWFEHYKAYVLYHADLANQSGAQALILGGEWVVPALPGGQISGVSSGVPAEASSLWQALLTEVRTHFNGRLLWAVSYPDDFADLPDFVNELDAIYILWKAPLGAGVTVNEMQITAGALLDNEILPFQNLIGKPVILSIAYPSMDGAAAAPLSTDLIFQPGYETVVDLQEQADIYQALLAAVNERPWIGGFVSRGYYPPAVLLDASASIHGKPAADVLWYWFPRFQGIAP